MYIIDGHNLLWSVHKVFEYTEEIMDVRLCRIISRYLKSVSGRGLIVFDGTGPLDKTIFGTMDNLEVVFSGPKKEADAVIETKIASDTAPKRLTVVSSDRRIRAAARARKAVSVKSERFWQDVVKRMNKRRKNVEPTEKRLGLDPAQTKQWLDYFGIEE